jgi:formylglycine-generating enzyme required for sulfatase activity
VSFMRFGFLVGLATLLLLGNTVQARPSPAEAKAVYLEADAGVDIRELLALKGWTSLSETSAQYATGQLWSPERKQMTACVEAEANTAPAKLVETKGSAGFMVSGRAGALAVSGGGEIQAEFIKVQKVTDSSTSVIDAFDLDLSERCRRNLIKRRSAGIDISAWWVITETFNATVIERSCEGKEAVAKAQIMLARGEISGESNCSEETIETGVIAFKGVPVTALLKNATVPVAVPIAASVPTAVAVPSQATASVDFGGGGGGLGVVERLRQQRCDETAKVKGQKARVARLGTAEEGAQSKAGAAWSGQSAELEMCASLKRAERGGCIEAVKAWLGVARAMVVSIPAGVEPIETECGTRQPVYEAVERAVVASDVKAAEVLLTRLESADPMSAGGPVRGSTNSIGMKFVTISPGSFEMGCTAEQSDCNADEKPAHTVTLTRGFQIQATEVTQGQYRAVMGSNPSKFSSCGLDCPVEKVSWNDAIKFANALSKKEGLSPAYSGSGASTRWDQSANGYRLPTEAEWEYAARGGKATRYSGSDKLGDVAWTSANSSSTTHKVGTKKANAWDLHDMTGNVWEWCWDWYDSSYYNSSPGTDPVGATSGDIRVRRGGSWYFEPASARVADRDRYNPVIRNGNLGLRLARTSP